MGKEGPRPPTAPAPLATAFDCSGGTEAQVPGRGARGDKLTVCTKKVLKFLASGRSSCDHGISPFKTLLTGST